MTTYNASRGFMYTEVPKADETDATPTPGDVETDAGAPASADD